MRACVSRSFALALPFLFSAPDATMSQAADRLEFSQAGTSRDATLAPFAMTAGNDLARSSRSVIYLPKRTLDRIEAIVGDVGTPVIPGSAQQPLGDDPFHVTRWQSGASRQYVLSGHSVSTIMHIVEAAFIEKSIASPRWIEMFSHY